MELNCDTDEATTQMLATHPEITAMEISSYVPTTLDAMAKSSRPVISNEVATTLTTTDIGISPDQILSTFSTN